MTKNRLEAFTDAIIPIIMTVLVLELGTPKTYTWSGLWDMHEQLIAYAISFFSPRHCLGKSPSYVSNC
ncbi:TMEM175 family protein [Lentilactobacillus kisonensis]|uniref:TMEM175 family protein n=1 Tax=Lentilactobacillus kisonensis TaxID=481722 RepID=UPI000B206513|nr:TMEM175 family protein [Lentilactobacillus kisonensis]